MEYNCVIKLRVRHASTWYLLSYSLLELVCVAVLEYARSPSRASPLFAADSLSYSYEYCLVKLLVRAHTNSYEILKEVEGARKASVLVQHWLP
jgi:hypothetical protein